MFIERMHETHYKSVTPKIIKLESQEYSFFFFFSGSDCEFVFIYAHTLSF